MKFSLDETYLQAAVGIKQRGKRHMNQGNFPGNRDTLALQYSAAKSAVEYLTENLLIAGKEISIIGEIQMIYRPYLNLRVEQHLLYGME